VRASEAACFELAELNLWRCTALRVL
jgi:hypothetical protein